VLTRVNATFGLDLPVQVLFAEPGLSAFATAVAAAGGEQVAVTARLARQIDELSDEEVDRLLAEQLAAQVRPPGGDNEVEGSR